MKSQNLISDIKIGYELYRRQKKAESTQMRWDSLWEWIEPIALASIFWALYNFRAIELNSSYPYAFFVVTGMLFWQTIIDGLMIPMMNLTKHKQLAKQVKLPSVALIASFFFKVNQQALARVVIILFLAAYLVGSIHVGYFLYFIYFELIIVTFVSLGCFLSLFNAVMSDVAKVIGILMRALIFLSGVIFPIPLESKLYEFVKFNPLFTLVEYSRELLLSAQAGSPSTLILYVLIAGTSLVVFGAAFSRSVKWVLERV